MVLGDEIMDKLIDTWIAAQVVDTSTAEYEKMSWAVDELFNIACDKPEKFLETVLEILKVDSSKTTIGALGAGAIEDFLVHHADAYIEKIVDLADSVPAFRSCLKYTFVDRNDVSEDVFEKLLPLRE